MEAFLPDHLASAEPGYCLVLFQTAVAALQEVASTHAEDAKSARMAQEALRRSQAADEQIAAVERVHRLKMIPEGDDKEEGDDGAISETHYAAARARAFDGIRGAVWRETGELEGAWAESPFTSHEGAGKGANGQGELAGGAPSSCHAGEVDQATSSAALVASLISDSGLGLQDMQPPSTSPSNT
jgi:hypothetical protein